MPDAFKRYMIIECEKLNTQELKEYMKELGQKLCGFEPGTLEYAIALTMLNLACEVIRQQTERHETEKKNLKTIFWELVRRLRMGSFVFFYKEAPMVCGINQEATSKRLNEIR